MISNTYFQMLKRNIKDVALGTSLSYFQDEQVKTFDFFSKIYHLADPEFHKKRVLEVAEYYIDRLEKAPKKCLKEALNDKFIYLEIRKFIRKEACYYKNEELIKKLKRYHLAAKLGISEELFNKNKGFFEYAAKSHLERYLFIHNHSIELKDEKICLMHNGVLTPWEEIVKSEAYEIKKQKENLATKFGITDSIIEKNKGFFEYASKGHLDYYTFKYGEKLKVEGDNICLMYLGKEISWNEIEKLGVQKDPLLEKSLRYPRFYDKSGVVFGKDFFIFDKLEPMFEEDPNKWGNLDLMEICSCKSVDNWMSIFTGVHSWFRIKTSDGKIYSFGLYRPEKLNGWSHLKFPFRRQVAYLGFEISEYWPIKKEDFCCIPIQITKEQREEILKQISKDKYSLTYQGFHENCVLYATSLLERFAQKTLPTHETPFGFFNPLKLRRITNHIPERIRRVCVAIASIFIVNPLQVLLGAAFVDKRVRVLHGDKKRAHISSVMDFFNPKKSLAHHPYTLMFKTNEWVKKWQLVEGKKLKKKKGEGYEEKLKNLQYQIPPNEDHYY